MHTHEGRTDVVAHSDGLSGDAVLSLFEDRESNLWAATTNGLDRFRQFAVATFTEKQGLSPGSVGPVLADKDGSVWLSTRGGLNRWNKGDVKADHLGSAKLGEKIKDLPQSLFQDSRGRVWVSTLRDFGYLENDRLVSVMALAGNGAVSSIAEDHAGNLWVANDRLGLFRLSPRAGVRKISWAELGHKDYASVLAADPSREGLWSGYFLGGIAYLAEGQVRESYPTANGLGEGHVSDLQFDHGGALWISTEGWLSRLKNSRLATLTSKNGLPCDTVHWTMEDDDHFFWLYMPCGLVRIARSQLDTWAVDVDNGRGTNRIIRFTVFDSSDGVRSHIAAGGFHPLVAKPPDGRLCFLPWDGVSVIDPRHIPFNKVPPPSAH